MIWPANSVVPPWPSLCPATSAVVVIVSARVSLPPNCTSLHTKQIRLTFEGEELSLLTVELGPSVIGRVAFGAAIHVAKELVITVATPVDPVTFEPDAGLRFHW